MNVACEKSDRLTVAKLNTTSKSHKQDYKSKLMTEKYSLVPINPQQLMPGQTALQTMSEKHPDFEMQAVNTIRPPDIEYTKTFNNCSCDIKAFSLDILTRSNTLKLFPFLLFIPGVFLHCY